VAAAAAGIVEGDIDPVSGAVEIMHLCRQAPDYPDIDPDLNYMPPVYEMDDWADRVQRRQSATSAEAAEGIKRNAEELLKRLFLVHQGDAD